MPFTSTMLKSSVATSLIGGALGMTMTTSAQTWRTPSHAGLQTSVSAPPESAVAALDSLPLNIQRQMLNPNSRFVESPGLVWRSPVVTVAFEGGSPAIYKLIEATANEWTDAPTRIHFSFRDQAGNWRRWSTSDTHARAAIRISFQEGAKGGYWSAVGVAAEGVSSSAPTMNFGGFGEDLAPFFNGQQPEAWRRSYYHTVILHEFGHSLGLSHEHFHPDCQVTLNMPQIIDYLEKRSGWTEEQAKFNADASYYQTQVEAADIRYKLAFSPHIDRSSVMLYNLPAAVIGQNSPCQVDDPTGYPTRLSAGDRQTFQRNYAPAEHR